MSPDQEIELYAMAERLTLSFEKIAKALTGLHDIEKRKFGKLYPKRPKQRDAIVTRAFNEDDRIKEAHGASDRPIDEWIGDLGEFVGVREKEFLEERDARAKAERERAETGAGPEAVGSEAV